MTTTNGDWHDQAINSKLAIDALKKSPDVDSRSFEGGQLRIQITTGADSANRLGIGGDFAVFANGNIFYRGVRIGHLNDKGGIGHNDLVVTFNANATQWIVKQLLRSITFRVHRGQPGIRHAVWTLTDGDSGTSKPVTKIINVFA